MRIRPATTVSTNGTYEDVAAFFRRSTRTIQEWKSANPPVIGHFTEGKNVCFGEEDVIDLWVRMHADARGLKPGEAQEVARRQWRAHMKIRYEDTALRREFEQLKERVDALNAKVVALEPAQTLSAA